MNVPQRNSQSIDSHGCTPAESLSTGLVLSRDLIFTAKIQATAAELGRLIQVARDVALAESIIGTQQPKVVFVDLTAGSLCDLAALSAYRKVAGSETWFVAFGPHVDVDAFTRAKAAGCHAVMPRSKFALELPKLIQYYFSQSRAQIC
jgi:hypothetical protein